MKSRWALITCSVLLLGFCGLVGQTIWNHTHLLYATPETESAFLKNYNPEHLIDQFKCGDEASGYGKHHGSEAGRESVTHTAGFDLHFAMRSDKWIPLMNALTNDAVAQLKANGATILHQTVNPHEGFQFDYQIGKSTGRLAILPLTIDRDMRRAMALPQGTDDVLARTEQTETWFPQGPGTTTSKNSDSIR